MSDSEILDEYIKKEYGNLNGLSDKYTEGFRRELEKSFGFAKYRLAKRINLLGKEIVKSVTGNK